FVVAAVLIAFGIAQRTVLRPADHVTVTASAPKDVAYIVIPGSVLRAHPGSQHLHLAGTGTAFAAYGRTADVTAWLSGQRYALARVGADGGTAAPVVRTAPVVAGLQGGHPDPDGSDLWLDQARASRSLDWTVNVPDTMSLLVAADGTAPAPSDVRVTWPVRVNTPWATPMIVTGSVLALLGLLLYIWALVHLRRRRGPRRKPPARMPKPPAPPKYRPVKHPVVVTTRGRRSVRHFGALAGGLAAGAALLTGCAGPVAAAPAPTSTAKAVAVTPAAVTEEQAIRIVARAAAVEHTADASLASSTLGDRFAGPALALRTAEYRLHKADKKRPLSHPIPATGATTRVILPEATQQWPRTLFTVVSAPASAKTAPLALTFVQQTPRDPYRVEYAVELNPGAQPPSLPSAVLGTVRLKPDTTLLSVPPGKLADDYGLLLRKSSAPVAASFDTAHDPLLKAVGQSAKAAVAKGLGSTAKVTFSDAATDPASIVALATADSGALVSVHLEETWKVTPTKSGVKVKPSGATRILAKTSSTTKGITSTYGYQLLFSVPPAGSKDVIELLGYAQGLVSAKEL
ncbi:MAG: hypothetical protein ACTHJL_10475, partial [Amnibacterium sp.]